MLAHLVDIYLALCFLAASIGVLVVGWVAAKDKWKPELGEILGVALVSAFLWPYLVGYLVYRKVRRRPARPL